MRERIFIEYRVLTGEKNEQTYDQHTSKPRGPFQNTLAISAYTFANALSAARSAKESISSGVMPPNGDLHSHQKPV
jgi:hypothetical protein